MSFIFRTAFWLALAIVILPPNARIGGQDTADFRDVDIELEVHNLSYSVWAHASNIMQSCDANPELCKATKELWNTAWVTVAKMAETSISAKPAETEEFETALVKTDEKSQ